MTDLDNLIPVDFTADRPAITIKRSRRCVHWSITIDEQEQLAVCKNCDAVLEPFQALMILTRDWGRYAQNLEHARHQLERKHKQLEDVDRELRNTKARLRRVNKTR